MYHARRYDAAVPYAVWLCHKFQQQYCHLKKNIIILDHFAKCSAHKLRIWYVIVTTIEEVTFKLLYCTSNCQGYSQGSARNLLSNGA